MTTNKDLATPANGSNVGAWDVPVNANFNAIDSAFGGKATIATTGGTTVLTSAQYQPIFLVITGVLTSNAIIQFPAGVGGQWVVLNSTTGAFTVTFSAGGGGGTYTLAQSIRTVIVCDGSTYGVTLSSNLAATAAAAGSSTQVQFNTSGLLDASANLTFNGTDLTVSGAVASGTLTPTTALAPAYGGTGATSLPSNAVLIGNNLGTIASVAPGTAGNVLTSNGTTWSSSVPATSGNVFLSGTPVNGQLAQWVSGTAVQGITTGTGVVTALGVNTGSVGAVLLNGAALTNSTGLPLTTGVTGTLPVGAGGLGITTTPSNGQIPIGDGTKYVAATVTAGNNITVTNAAGAITVATTAFASMTVLTASNASWPIPAGVTRLKVTVVGAGGNGGTGSGLGEAGGGGGGGGGASIQVLGSGTPLTPGNTLNVTVGTTAGATSSIASGTQSIVTVQATGGSTAGASLIGGAAGVGSGGSLNFKGSAGGSGSASSTTGGNGGAGGGSYLGGGGAGGAASPLSVGSAGGNYGGGGGGGGANTTGGGLGGGAFAPGVVMIEY